MEKLLYCQHNLLHVNPYMYFKNLKHATRRLTEQLILLLQKYDTLYISQQTLADMVGISRCYCSTIINRLERDGVFVIKNRFNNSNIYRLSSFMMRNDILHVVSRAMAVFSNFLDKTFNSIKKKLTLSIESLFIKKENTGLPHTGCVQRNDISPQKQEKLMRFIKGTQIIWGKREQAEFYESLGYEKLE